MSPNIDPTDLSGQLLTFLRALNDFETRDTPPHWSKDEYNRWEDNRDELAKWREALVESIQESLARP